MNTVILFCIPDECRKHKLRFFETGLQSMFFIVLGKAQSGASCAAVQSCTNLQRSPLAARSYCHELPALLINCEPCAVTVASGRSSWLQEDKSTDQLHAAV